MIIWRHEYFNMSWGYQRILPEQINLPKIQKRSLGCIMLCFFWYCQKNLQSALSFGIKAFNCWSNVLSILDSCSAMFQKWKQTFLRSTYVIKIHVANVNVKLFLRINNWRRFWRTTAYHTYLNEKRTSSSDVPQLLAFWSHTIKHDQKRIAAFFFLFKG